MNYQTVLSKATKILKGQLIKNPKLDCEILLSNALKIEREKLLVNLNQEINGKDLNKFNDLTNCPLLINTSMNVRGEPIVNTPQHALNMLTKTDMDYLVIGNYIIQRQD